MLGFAFQGRCRIASVFCALVANVSVGHAAEHRFSLMFDTDNVAATGCTVSTVNGPVSGIERIATAVVSTTTTTATVARLEQQTCIGGTLSAAATYDTGGWSAGLGNGPAGSAAIEFSVPLTSLPRGATVKALAASRNALGQEDATGSFLINISNAVAAVESVPVPLSRGLAALLVAMVAVTVALRFRRQHSSRLVTILMAGVILSTLAWAATVVRDGNIADWAGVSAAVTDASGDAPTNADIRTVYHQQDDNNLYVRIDADVRLDAPTNLAPVVNAGANQTITLPAAATLAGTATDDGLPNPPATLTISWSKVSGPGTVTFANANAASTSATFGLAGSYVLRLTASDSALSTSRDVTVTVNPVVIGANRAPTVSAGPAQSITLPANVSLAGSATDDGLPNPPAALTTAWTQLSGPPGGTTFLNAAAPASLASFSAPGVYVLQLSAFDGALTSVATVEITVLDGPPAMNAIADSTIELGTRFQQTIIASDNNRADSLTYSLPAAPSGAALSPAPLIDWTPTAAQLGTHTFTAQVTDGGGRSASRSFTVTVVRTNQPPALAFQEDVLLRVGATFTRTLQATDPNLGDSLTFSVRSGPPGLTLTGDRITWNTTGAATGSYPVSVRVTDSAGAVADRSFTIALIPAAGLPVARDDDYSVQIGKTLVIPAERGVLANDIDPASLQLTASKQSDPAKGSLSSFNANGSFTYVAPAAPPANAFNPEQVRQLQISTESGIFNWQLADLNGDGFPDLVFLQLNGVRGKLSAFDIKNNAFLWQTDASTDGCWLQAPGKPFKLAIGDLDDDGIPDIATVGHCSSQNTVMNRIFAFDGRTGAMKWKSDNVNAPGVVGLDPVNLADFGQPLTVARVRAGEKPSVVLGVVAFGGVITARDGIGNAISRRPACEDIVKTVPDGNWRPDATAPLHYYSCVGAIILNGETGAIAQRMIADAGLPGATTVIYGAKGNECCGMEVGALVADFDGSGQNKIALMGAVWNLDGTRFGSAQPGATWAAALGNFDDSPDIEIVSVDKPQNGPAQLRVKKADGRVLWSMAIPTVTPGHITVTDLDGDGKADILLNVSSDLWAIDHRGRVRWIHAMPCGDCYFRNGSNSRPMAFDLDGDGVPEVVTTYRNELRFIDGLTGELKASRPTLARAQSNGVWQYEEMARIVDVDADGRADIVTLSSAARNACCSPDSVTSVLVFSDAAKQWRPTRKIDNQWQYHGSNVNDNGTIPTTVPLPNTFTTTGGNIFGTQPQILAPVDPRLRDQTSFTYSANNGALSSLPATVKISIDPQNRPPKFTSTPPTRHNGSLSYQATAVDPNVGDALTYAIITQINTVPCSINSATGLLTCARLDVYVPPADNTDPFFVISATDSLGATAWQSFTLKQSTTSCTVPNVAGLAQAAAATAVTTAGCGVGDVSESYSPTIAAGTVISQLPIAATVILGGEAVSLVVSKGAAPSPIPDVIGQLWSNAQRQLTGSGFTSTVSTVASASVPANVVMTQSPVSGTVAPPGTTVALTVSAGAPLSGTVTQVIVAPNATTQLAGSVKPYTATAIFADGSGADVTLRALWSSASPGVASIDAAGRVTSVSAGSSAISATVAGVTGQATHTVLARVADTVAPVATISSPVDGGVIIGPVDVVGSASDANFLRYELAFSPAGEGNFTLIKEGVSPVTAGVLGRFDPTTLINDQYTLRLRVFDRSDTMSETSVTVSTEGQRKVGLYTLGFEDLTVPMTGIPISVVRTYDSRDKSQGDFGVGWRMGMSAIRIRANRPLGTGWVRTVTGPTTRLNATSNHTVSVTLPDGKVERFDMIVSPTSNLGTLDATTVTGFAPQAGTLGKLELLDNNSLLILAAGAEDELFDDFTLAPFAPKRYRYITVDGVKIDVSTVSGLLQMEDRNGNRVSFSADGITHSSGKSVSFTRDTAGRITQITDPMGSSQSYAYDANGDLVRHVSRTGGQSSYRYDYRHNLIEITEPTGIRATKNEFDAEGRLIAVIDSLGRRISVAHDPNAQTEVYTDPAGNTQTVAYDPRGNVLSQSRAVTINGTAVTATTTYAYDGNDNQTLVVNPDGTRIVSTFTGKDPLTEAIDPTGVNLTTTYAYNGQGDPTSVTDAAGRPVTVAYDSARNITAVNMPAIGGQTVTLDARGQATSRTDALGTRTAITRDSFGNVTREEVFSATNLSLRKVDRTFDANGRVLTQTVTLTVNGVPTSATSSTTYDADGRVLQVTSPNGATTRSEYDAAGRVVAIIDPLGRRTTYSYDALGRSQGTTYPDGSTDSMTYDLRGNVATETDQAGRVTTHSYDELNRRVSSVGPDGATVKTIYSVGGRVEATIDARGNRTDFTYDSAGRRIRTTLAAVTDALINTTARPTVSSILSNLGQPTQTTDPLSRVTTYTYDTQGRPTDVVFPDGGRMTQVFDSLGRRTRVTNEEGQATSYTYDALGRLIAVSGLAGDASYVYDEAGLLLSQTDALGRATRFEYDISGRRVKKIYPGGDTERWSYDVIGNVVSRTDPSGRSTSFAYDVMNRLIEKVSPGGIRTTYTYNPDGKRASVTDSRGTTTYGYDAAGRLTRITHPDGNVVTSQYDANGNLIALASPAASVSYSYDALNRLTQVAAPEGNATYAYDLAGQRRNTTAANGVKTDVSYNTRGWPTNIAHLNAANSTLLSFAQTFTAAGRRASVTELNGAVESYGYDTRGRLISVNRTGSGAYSQSYTYDDVGNRLTNTLGGVTTNYVYDNNDRLLSAGGDSYSYDGNSNLTRKTGASGNTQYAYDEEDRLNWVNKGGVVSQYRYDADGARVERTVGSQVTKFLVDGRNPTGFDQVLEERSAASALNARFTQGSRVLTQTRGGTTHALLGDGLGSVRALTTSAGALSDSYQYDAYGVGLANTGTTENPYGYAGERRDAESDLIHLRARQYDPSMGRFLNRDPFGGQLNTPTQLHRYNYVSGDPVNRLDPSGLFDFTLIQTTITQSISSTIQYARAVAHSCGAFAKAQTVAAIAEAGFTAASAIGQSLQDAPTNSLTGYDLGGGNAIGANTTASSSSWDFTINENATPRQLRAVKFGLTGTKNYGAGRISFEMGSISRQQLGDAGLKSAGAGFEVRLAYAPLTIRGSALGKIVTGEQSWGCPGLGAKSYWEFYVRGFGGGGGDGKGGRAYTAGAGIALDWKLDAFGGFSFTVPMGSFEIDVAGGTVTTGLFGLYLTTPLPSGGL